MNINFKTALAALWLTAAGTAGTARAQPVVDLPPPAPSGPAPAPAPTMAPLTPVTRLVRETPVENALDHPAPMEGSAFVAQLAQFSSLEELTKIRSSMDTVRQLLTQSSTDANQTNAL